MKVVILSLALYAFAARAPASAININLGTADPFAVLGGSTVTNTGATIIDGSVGLWAGTSIIGFPPGIVTPPGTIHATDAVAQQAQNDLTTAYNCAAGESCSTVLTGTELGGLTLPSGG